MPTIMFFFTSKRGAGTQSNSTVQQHFPGLPPHPSLCLHFIANRELLKTDQIQLLRLQLIPCTLRAGEALCLAVCRAH